MRRTARSLVLLLTPALAVAATVAPANADPVSDARAMLSLSTTASISGTSVTVTAHGEFVGGIIDNSTVALQVGGEETWIDSRGTARTMPFACHGEAVRFSETNTVSCTANLQSPDSVITVVWTAEAVGAAPTVFFGSCAGVGARSGGTTIVRPVC